MKNNPTGSGTAPDPKRIPVPKIYGVAAPPKSAEVIEFPPEKKLSAKSIRLNPGEECGEGGEGGSPAALAPSATTNRQFAETIFNDLPPGARPLVTAKAGDPSEGPWIAHEASQIERICAANLNTYLNCASFVPNDEGAWAATRKQVAAYHFLLLDDVGTKVEANPEVRARPYGGLAG